MKAVITIDLQAASAEAAQRALFDLCDEMKRGGLPTPAPSRSKPPKGR